MMIAMSALKTIEIGVGKGSHSRKNGHHLPVRKKFVTILDDLVCSDYDVEIVLVQKPLYDVRTKGERDAPLILGKTLDVFIGVGPQHIAKEARVRHVRGPLPAAALGHSGPV